MLFRSSTGAAWNDHTALAKRDLTSKVATALNGSRPNVLESVTLKYHDTENRTQKTTQDKDMVPTEHRTSKRDIHDSSLPSCLQKFNLVYRNVQGFNLFSQRD
jgi:hypothetical protein